MKRFKIYSSCAGNWSAGLFTQSLSWPQLPRRPHLVTRPGLAPPGAGLVTRALSPGSLITGIMETSTRPGPQSSNNSCYHYGEQAQWSSPHSRWNTRSHALMPHPEHLLRDHITSGDYLRYLGSLSLFIKSPQSAAKQIFRHLGLRKGGVWYLAWS